MRAIRLKSLVFFLLLAAVPMAANARTVSYDLVLAQTAGPDVNGQKAMTINGSLPGPTLRFTEGDDAVLRGDPSIVHQRSILPAVAARGVQAQ